MTTPSKEFMCEALVAALIIMARHGIEPDIQELLVSGNVGRGIKPGALSAALRAAADKARAEERRRLYDADAPMADGEIEMTAAEDVLTWLLVEKIGVPDDEGYTPNQAQTIIETTIMAEKEMDNG